jgi:hypothetical protein
MLRKYSSETIILDDPHQDSLEAIAIRIISENTPAAVTEAPAPGPWIIMPFG